MRCVYKLQYDDKMTISSLFRVNWYVVSLSTYCVKGLVSLKSVGKSNTNIWCQTTGVDEGQIIVVKE